MDFTNEKLRNELLNGCEIVLKKCEKELDELNECKTRFNRGERIEISKKIDDIWSLLSTKLYGQEYKKKQDNNCEDEIFRRAPRMIA